MLGSDVYEEAGSYSCFAANSKRSDFIRRYSLWYAVYGRAALVPTCHDLLSSEVFDWAVNVAR